MIYLELFWTFFKIGAFTFGGGYAMLPLVQSEVLAHGWMSSEELVNFIAVSESTPGPFAVNVSTYVGAETGGVAGAFLATLGVVLPSFLIILLVARGFEKFRDSRAVKGCMSGLRPAVVGLIGAAAVSVGETVFFPAGLTAGTVLSFSFLASAVIFVIMAVLALKNVHPILIIAFSAVLGIAGGFLQTVL